ASPLERDVAVPAGGTAAVLAASFPQGPDQDRARPTRLDHIVDVAALGGDVRVGEALAVVADQLRAFRGPVLRCFQLTAIDNVDGTFGVHHRNLGGGPGDVDVGANVLLAHDAVRACVVVASCFG